MYKIQINYKKYKYWSIIISFDCNYDWFRFQKIIIIGTCQVENINRDKNN